MVCKLLSHGGEILIPDRLLEADSSATRQALALVVLSSIAAGFLWVSPAS